MNANVTAKAQTADVSEIPEVQRYEAVCAEMQQARAANPAFFKWLDDWKERHNDAREAADKAVRSRQVSCGPFTILQWETRYNADELYQAVGPEKFLSLGGIISQTVKYECDKKRVDFAIEAKLIPPEVAEKVRKRSPKYRVLPKAELP
jgi:hypothetical protein